MLLAHAAWYGYTATVSLLANLEGVDVNSRDYLGRTPLFLAVINGRYDVVYYLCNRADVEQGVIDSTGQTLRMAAQDNEDRIMLVLLGSFNLRTEEPLLLAARDFLHIAGFVIALIALCWQISSLI
jgi:ankyrin repeat protein